MKPVLRNLGALVFAFCLIASAARAEQGDLRKDVQVLLESFREAYGFPGATVAYVTDDGTVETVAVGMADVEAGIAMTTDSRMLAASIGKTIWGALVLDLEAEGLLSQSDLVSSYLGDEPWFARLPNSEAITIGQLATHSAGLPDHVHMEGVAARLISLGDLDQPDPAELISFILDEPALFEAGTAWAYTDTGYVLLGMVLKSATGRGVFNLAEDRILGPLGLTATTPSNSSQIEGLAVGYTGEINPFGLDPRTMDEHGRLSWNPVVEWTGGGFASTSADLAKWGHVLFTGKAFDVDYLSRLLEGVAISPEAPGVSYGTGVAVYEETPFGPVYGHGGWIPGYVSSLRHYADYGLTIAFQINTDIGVLDDSTDLIPALETALVELLVGAANQLNAKP